MNLPPDSFEVLTSCNMNACPKRMAAISFWYKHLQLILRTSVFFSYVKWFLREKGEHGRFGDFSRQSLFFCLSTFPRQWSWAGEYQALHPRGRLESVSNLRVESSRALSVPLLCFDEIRHFTCGSSVGSHSQCCWTKNDVFCLLCASRLWLT